MKFLICSDIHGSAYYCELLLSAIQTERPDKILLLGDILYHGPRNDLPKDYAPKRVIEMLNPLKDKIICVRGNCDAEVDQMVLDFPIMADFERIENLYLSHGHIYNEKNLPPMQKGDILINGHTHIPKCEKIGDFVFMNCGSVSIPKENSVHSYMIYQNGEFLWKNLQTKETYNSFK